MVSDRKSNSFIQIFENHWGEFKDLNPEYDIDHLNSVVSKMISCGDPSEGFIEYQCTHCGDDSHIIGFSCKSSLCLKCGAIKAFNFVEEVMAKLHKGMTYRHLTMTMPKQLRWVFYQNRNSIDLYNRFYEVAWECICNLLSWMTGLPLKRLKAGCIMVMHIPGRDAKYNPHIHVILMDGVLDQLKNKWHRLRYFPYKVFRKKWQYFLSNMISDFDPSEKTKKLINYLWKKYRNDGFVFRLDPRDVPKRSLALARYLSKYLFRPSISVKRILKYDRKNKTVLFEYACHETGKLEKLELSVYDFIGRMVLQVLPKGFQRVRYYGLQASSSYKKSVEQIQMALGNETEIIRDKEGNVVVKRAARLSFREKILKWNNKDPLRCKKCGRVMEIVKVWVKGRGYVYNWFEDLERAPPLFEKTVKKSNNLMNIKDELSVQLSFFAEV